jgi:hypothetical protein
LTGAERIGQATLINVWHISDNNKRSPLQLRQAFVCEGFADDTETHLLQAAHEVPGNATIQERDRALY